MDEALNISSHTLNPQDIVPLLLSEGAVNLAAEGEQHTDENEERATKVGSLLEEILHRKPARWGLNE